MSRIKIQELAKEIATLSIDETTSILLEKARELYEKTTLLHYNTPSEELFIEEENNIKQDSSTKKTEPTDVTKETPEANKTEEDRPLSIQERIKQIMEAAPRVSSDNNQISTIEKTEEIVTPQIEQKIEIPQKTTVAEEFKDAISADYAANLFEKAKKIEITKKSLNDKLSQKQLQIGLNDRIAFVKHLFAGNQSDFNRVLSQLNTFSDEAQAKHFIETVVKPDYNWESEVEYEERLLALIERKFL